MRETRWESSWGNYRTSRWLNHWWRPFEPQCCSRKLNYPHNLFVLYVHPSVVQLPLPCVCMFVETVFDYLAECVKSSWSALRLHMARFNHVTPTGYYLFYGVSHDYERLRPQTEKGLRTRWCLKAPDLLSLVIRLKVIFFGHFGPQFRWWSNFLLTLSILKLDPQDQTPLLLHSIDSIKPTPGAKNSMDFLAVR